MGTTTGLAMAEIKNEQTSEVVRCFFNPKEYTLSKQNKWEEKTAKGESVPHMEFAGGSTGSLKLQLLFDTYEVHQNGGTPPNSAGQDVRVYTQRLWGMMEIAAADQHSKTKKGAPPKCRFTWGSYWAFLAVIESISEKFILFKSDGTPVRSIIDISFKQIKNESKFPGQNPTSGGSPGDRLRVAREGDTLAWIAYQEYGDPTAWRHIAEANGLDNPRQLQPGVVLLVPALPIF
jgi:hypothetical protein